MEQRKDIGRKVDDVLASMDGIERASAGPWFYTRLQARMQRDEKTPWATISSFLARPGVAVASLCLILVMNVFFLLSQSNQPSAVNNILSSEGMVESESIIASSSSFDYENFAP